MIDLPTAQAIAAMGALLMLVVSLFYWMLHNTERNIREEWHNSIRSFRADMLDQMNLRMDRLTDQMNARTDQMNARMDQTNERMDHLTNQMNARMDQMTDQMTDQMNARMDHLTDQMNARMDRLSDRMDQMDRDHREILALLEDHTHADGTPAVFHRVTGGADGSDG